MKLIKIEGKRFGSFTVLQRTKNRYYGRHTEIWYKVKCDCGRVEENRGYMIRTGRVTACKNCKPKGFRHGLCGTKEYQIWNTAKSRADELGVKFTLTPSDIYIPNRCPLLGIKLCTSNDKTKYNSPSLDRKNHRRGYIKNNVWVISQKANTIKSNATLPELQKLVNNLEKVWHSSI